MSGELVPAGTITVNGREYSKDPAVRLEQQRANIMAAKTGAIARTESQAKIEAFDAQQRAAGAQMTGEQSTRHQQSVQTFHDQLAYAKALEARTDKNGRVSSDVMNACTPLLSGYRLPGGITVNPQSVYVMLQVARKAGFQQSHVDAYIRAEQDLGLFT